MRLEVAALPFLRWLEADVLFDQIGGVDSAHIVIFLILQFSVLGNGIKEAIRGKILEDFGWVFSTYS